MKTFNPKMRTVLLIAAITIIGKAFGQVPTVYNLLGPSSVCSEPAAAKSYTAIASNSPTGYLWYVIPSANVSIGNPTGSVTTISFPNTNSNYSVYCMATNGSGSGPANLYVVSVFETPTVTFSGANIFCQGSSTNLSASPTIISASSTLSYNWSPSTGLNTTTGNNVIANPPVNTTYSVLLTIGSCTNEAQVSVTVNPLPNVSAVAVPTAVCMGQPVTIVSSGASTYSLGKPLPPNITVTPSITATYTVIGTDANGCNNTATVFIHVAPLPSLSALVQPTVICKGEKSNISINGSAISYSLNGVTSSGSASVSPVNATTYTVEGTASNGCVATTTVLLNVNQCVGIRSAGAQESDLLTIFPNPNNGTFILLSGKTETARLINELGQEIRTVNLEASVETKVVDLKPGIYFVVTPDSRFKIIVSN
jgi:hypothetical protein